MKLSIKQDDLAAAVNQARRATNTKTGQLPILGNVKLTATPSALTISATNLHLGIAAERGTLAVETPGETTVDAAMFSAFVQSLPSGQLVDMDLAGQNGHSKLKVQCGTIKASFGVLSADDFPVSPQPEAATTFTIYGAVLSERIGQVEHSAAKDDSRPVLAGASIAVEGDRITLATADGFSLSVTEAKLSAPIAEPIRVIVPIAQLRELAALTREMNTDISLAVTPAASLIVAELPGTRWWSSLIEGSFPDYRQIVPRDWRTEIEVNRDDLLAAIKRARVFAATKDNQLIRFTLGTDGLTVAGVAVDRADTESTVLADVTGEPAMTWCLDGRYAIPAIDAVSRSDVWIGLNGPNQAVVIRPERDAKQTCVIMPMALGAN